MNMSLSVDRNDHVGIIGAGPVGSLLSIFLARKGISSTIYERRPDMRTYSQDSGRSINLAISFRGLQALQEIGLEDVILKKAIPMFGRMIHSIDGGTKFQPYGNQNKDCIYSISRGDLNKVLMTFAEDSGKVKIQFQNRATNLDLQRRVLSIHDENKNTNVEINYSTLFATDGSTSLARTQIMNLPGYTCTNETLDYGYKEITLPPATGQHFLLEKHSLHIWPRGTYMLIALPNLNGSFTCTLFLPHLGNPSFQLLTSTNKVATFFRQEFPDIIPLIPDLPDQFFANPIGNMGTIKCSPWNFSGNVLLLGDAAHGIVPFFGQGMNCGFEDCTILNQLLSPHLNWEEIFTAFSKARKEDTDKIADMALENFIEMRDKVGRPSFLIEKSVEAILQKHFPGQYISRYSLVTFSGVPYTAAYKIGLAQNKILKTLCEKIQSPEEVDLQKAKLLIDTHLKPLLRA